MLSSWNKCECYLYTSMLEEKSNRQSIKSIAKQLTSNWVSKNIFSNTAPYCAKSEMHIKAWVMDRLISGKGLKQEKENNRSKSPMPSVYSVSKIDACKNHLENGRRELEEVGSLVNNKIMNSLYPEKPRSRNVSPRSFSKPKSRPHEFRKFQYRSKSKDKGKVIEREDMRNERKNEVTFGGDEDKDDRKFKKHSSDINISPRTIKKIKNKIDLLYSIDSKNWTAHDKKFIADLGENSDILEIIQKYY